MRGTGVCGLVEPIRLPHQPVAWRVIFAAFTRPNAALWWVVAATAAILIGVILFPPARELFHFGPLHGDDILVALASGLIALLLLELAKRLVRPLSDVRRPRTGTVTQ